jgi:hypothetical protein
MNANIAGHALTNRETEVLDTIRDYMRNNSGDSSTDANSSPAGDGRYVPLVEIFPRTNLGTSSRRIAYRLDALGVLRACEISLVRGSVRLEPSSLWKDRR